MADPIQGQPATLTFYRSDNSDYLPREPLPVGAVVYEDGKRIGVISETVIDTQAVTGIVLGWSATVTLDGVDSAKIVE